MRTGADYRNSLRDGRRVFVLGEGKVDDVTTHPATQAMVEQYVAWYDRHADPAWKDTLFGPDGAAIDYVVPKTSDDLVRLGRCISATTFLSAGNITHTPAYGHLIALGVLHAVGLHKASPEQVANAEAYRAEIARTGRPLTFAARRRADRLSRCAITWPIEWRSRSSAAQTQVSPCAGKDRHAHQPRLRRRRLYRRGQRRRYRRPSRHVRGAGECQGCDRDLPPSRDARRPTPFTSPLSTHFDELDGQMWLDDVMVPWNRVFLTEPSPEPVARWLFWHQLYCWLSKAEFTLGLALACTQAMGLSQHELTLDYLLDLITDVQTVRACQTAAERDPEMTTGRILFAQLRHLAAGQHRHARRRGGAWPRSCASCPAPR